MKKVVIVSGSSRKGNTYAISKVYAQAFEKAGFSTRVISLAENHYELCTGCLACDETQKCVINDGFEDVINQLREAEMIVFGTPTRWRLLSGELKAFLDRLNPYAAVEGYSGLKTFVFAVGQSDEEAVESINTAIESVCSFAKDAGMEILGKQAFCSMLGETDYEDFSDEIQKTCENNVSSVLGRIL